MSIYVYKALTKEGRETQGELQAPNRQIAIEYLQRDNLTPLFLEEKGNLKNARRQFLILLLAIEFRRLIGCF